MIKLFRKYSNIALSLVVMIAVALLSAGASATVLAAGAHATTVTNTICNIINEMQGPIARGVAAFGIVFLGFSLFLGKISWGVALALGIGLGAVFGARQIVGLIGDGTTAC